MMRLILLIGFIFTTMFVNAQAPDWIINTGAPVKGFKTDLAGNIYAFGTFTNTIDFNPGSEVFNLSSNGSTDVFCVKYDASGNFVWAFKIGEGLEEDVFDLQLHNNEIYLLGSFKDTVDFDHSSNSNLLTTSPNVTNIFLAKYSMTDGQYVWAGTIGGDTSINFNSEGFYYSSPPALTINNIDNTFYIAGKFNGTVDFDLTTSDLLKSALGTTEDAFIVKYNNNGTPIWCHTYGSETFITSVSALLIDQQGNLIVAGAVKGPNVDLNPGEGEFLITTQQYTNSNFDYFYTSQSYVSKFNTNGEFISARLFNYGISGISRSLTQGEDNTMYLVLHYVTQLGFFDITTWFKLIKLDDVDTELWQFTRANAQSYPKINGLIVNSTNDVIFAGTNAGLFFSKYNSFGYPIFGGPNQSYGAIKNAIGDNITGQFTDVALIENDGFLISGNMTAGNNVITGDFDISSNNYDVVINNYKNFIVKYSDFVLELDDDGDGIYNDLDDCLNTPMYEIGNIDTNGCAGGDNNNNGIDDNIEVLINDNPSDIVVCDVGNNGQEIFNLTLNQEEILNGQPASNLTFSYHLNLNNANGNTNPISNPTAYSGINLQTIYVRVQRLGTIFYDVTNFQLSTIATPILGYAPTLVVCDDNNDGIAIFNLTANEVSIANGNSLQFKYYENQEDATSDNNAIINPQAYTNTINSQTIYVSAQDINSGCVTTTQFNLLASQTICQFELPSNNFTIQTFSETCLNVENGQMIISAIANYDYEVSLTLDGNTIDIPTNIFTDTLTISDLMVGEYELCISIPSENYSICYTIIIDTSASLSRVSMVENANYRAYLTGSTTYYVTINETTYTVNSSSAEIALLFEKELTQPSNTILIKSNHECQGSLKETIWIDENLIFKITPNPFNEVINLSLLSKEMVSKVYIYDTVGKLVFQQEVQLPLSNYSLNLEVLNSGMYFIHISNDTNTFIKHLIKK